MADSARLVPVPRELNDPITITFREQNRRIVIEPDDRTRYLTQVNKVMKAYEIAENILVAGEKFGALLEEIGSWILARREKIDRAFMTMQDDSFLLLIVLNSAELDQEFEDELTDLDIKIANNSEYEPLHLSVLDLPKCTEDASQAFISPVFCLNFQHAEQESP